MKIKKQILKDFLGKVCMKGVNQINEAVFDFTTTGLKVSAVDSAEVIRIDGTLQTSAFDQYEAIGKIGMQDLTTMQKLLNNFSKEINFVVEGNGITFSEGNKKIEASLMDIQFIKATKDLNLPTFAENFSIPANVLNGFISDISINKDCILTMRTGEKQLLLASDGKYKFSEVVPAESAVGGHKALFGEPLYNAVANLNGMLDIGMQSNFPLRIMEKTDVSIINLIVAPRGSDDEVPAEPQAEQPETISEE